MKLPRATPQQTKQQAAQPAPSEWHNLNIQVTKEQYAWLNEQRFKTGKSIALLVRDILDRHILNREE